MKNIVTRKYFDLDDNKKGLKKCLSDLTSPDSVLNTLQSIK